MIKQTHLTLQSHILKFYNEIHKSFEDDLVKFTELFISCYSFKTIDLFGWEHWIEIPEGQVTETDFNDKLVLFYCIKSLQILAGKTDEDIESIEIPHNRDFIILTESRDSPIRKKISNIQSNYNLWKKILHSKDINKIDKFIKLLEVAVNKYKTEEENAIIESPLRQNKISDFKIAFKKEFYNAATLRKVIKLYGKYKDSTNTIVNPEQTIICRYNITSDKLPFIDKWNESVQELAISAGEDIGRRFLAQDENNKLFQEIFNNISNSFKSENVREILNDIDKLTSDLKNRGATPNLALVSFDIPINFRKLIKITKFSRERPKINIENYIGHFELKDLYIPVFSIFIPGSEKFICFLEINKFGELIQYAPYDNEEDKKFVYDIFYIRIRDLSREDELRQQVIERRTQNKEDQENRERYFKQKVIINIYEKFKFKVKDENAGFKILLA